MNIITFEDAERQSFAVLLRALEQLNSSQAQWEHAMAWYATLTHGFTYSVSDNDVFDLHIAFQDFFNAAQLIEIFKFDINTPDKLILFLDEAHKDQQTFNRLMDYYFNETCCTQGYDLTVKFQCAAFYGQFSALGYFIMQATETMQQKLYGLYILEAIEAVKIQELNALLQYSPEKMAAALGNLDPQLSVECCKLLEIKATRIAGQYVSRMVMGDIDAETASLICAALADGKTYPFQPVIVEMSDLASFIELLGQYRDSLAGHSVNFIVAGVHWISARLDIGIDHCHLCIVDSIGKTAEVVRRLEGAAQALLELAYRYLRGVKIYFLEEDRQHALSGCSVFAIDDSRHLHTVERYLPTTYAERGLFGYLEDHSYSVKLDNQLTVLMAQTPLPLLRTMQSRSLFAVIQQRGEEENTPVNKRGDSAIESSRKHFVISNGREQNQRIQHKLSVFRRKTLEFLGKYDDEVVLDKILQFSLEHYRDTLVQRQVDRLTLTCSPR